MKVTIKCADGKKLLRGVNINLISLKDNTNIECVSDSDGMSVVNVEENVDYKINVTKRNYEPLDKNMIYNTRNGNIINANLYKPDIVNEKR